MDESPEEHVLAARAREGDREALAQLVERWRLWLFASAYAEARHYEDAQDAVAATLLRACARVGELREPARMRAWVAAIARNEARRISGRGRRYLPAPAADDEAAPGETGVDQGAAACLRIDIDRALRALPADQAQALSLFYLAGVSIREIALRTERPEGTVKSWLHEGRRRLAREMKEYAPMNQDWTAAIVSTELEPSAVTSLADALRAGGWSRVKLVADYGAAAKVKVVGEGEQQRKFHLPEALAGSRFIILDEWIGGRSAFELLPILNAAAERKSLRIGLLVQAAAESTSFAAWAAGVDLFLEKPVDPAEFQRFAERLRRGLERPA